MAAVASRASVHAISLQNSVNMVRRVFDREFTAEQLTYRIGSSQSHLAWLAGHIPYAFDVVMNPVLGGRSIMPPTVQSLFAMGSAPSPLAADYPPVVQCMEWLDLALEQTTAKVSALTDADLAAPLPADTIAGKLFPSMEAAVAMLTYHTAYHTGQAALLLRALGLSGPFSF